MRDDLHVRIDVVHLLARGIELLSPHVGGAVDDLPLQIGLVDDVEIHNPHLSDAGGSQIKCQRRSEPSGANQ